MAHRTFPRTVWALEDSCSTTPESLHAAFAQNVTTRQEHRRIARRTLLATHGAAEDGLEDKLVAEVQFDRQLTG